jgi:8-oxo-dGTP pyrophosphatase MutT (NUDIX family)
MAVATCKIHDQAVKYVPMVHSTVQCINCGNVGHIAKRCNDPVTSCGLICYRKRPTDDQLEFLFVQRKDTLTFIEFMRGKYLAEDTTYLLTLFSNMATYEKERIRTMTFDQLWTDLWMGQLHPSRSNAILYTESKRRFEKLRRGFTLFERDRQTVAIENYGIDWLLDHCENRYHETEWELPKGRRQAGEMDIACAMREFYEETGISPNKIAIDYRTKPVDEIFTGMNHIRYRYIYYVATLKDGADFRYDETNKKQINEIRNVAWFTLDDACIRLRDMNVERKELLKRVHRSLTAR